MCNLSDHIEERGMQKGIEQGVAALVQSLKNFIPDTEKLYQAVIQNEAYKNISKEDVLKYL